MREYTNIEQVNCDNCNIVKVIDNFDDLEKVVKNPFCDICTEKLLDEKEMYTINRVLELHKHALCLSDNFILERVYVGFDAEGKLHLTVSAKS